ncbi:tyrosine-type recombinase/integrase [Cryobacterium sp. AP23]
MRRSTRRALGTIRIPLLNRELIAALKVHLLTHPNSGDPDALFWPGRSNGSRRLDWTRPIDLGGVLKYYRRPAASRAGIFKSICFHDLCHTCTSLMFAAGFKPYEVSRWMGHASVATTDGVYARLYPSDYNEQIARFEAFVAEG